MIGFIIKKAFFDTWDNLLKVILFNLMALPFLLLAYFGVQLISQGALIGFLFVFIAIVLVVMHQGTVAYFLRDIGDSISTPISHYFKYFKTDISFKIKFSVGWVFFITLTSFSIFHYLNGEGMLSLIPLALVFWFSTMTSIAILFFYPIKIRLQGEFKKVIKKCFILLLDNPFAGIFIFIYSIILIICSIPSLGLLPPGLGSIGCLLDTTVHMYELKYDYLENNPDADRKKIPWGELTYELNENLGPRSLKGMIFPWKD